MLLLFNPQSMTASYQRRYTNGTSSAFVLHWTFKRENTGSFSRIKKINVMDKSGIENLSKSEVIGRCGGNEKNPNDHAEPTKVER